MRTSSRNFAVLLFDEVELWDVASVMQVTSMAGRHWNWRPFRLLPTALEQGLVETRSQIRLEAKVALSDCPIPEILLVPGGYGARRAAQDERIVAWCRHACLHAELTLAIGAGVMVLGAAGVLDGAEVAAASDARAWLSSALPNTRLNETQPIVSSLAGKLLTVANASHGVELGLAVVERCLGARAAASLRMSMGYAAASGLELHEPLDMTKITLPPR